MKWNLKLILIKEKHVKFKNNKRNYLVTLLKLPLKPAAEIYSYRNGMTNGNVRAIYEKFYVPTLMKEVGLRRNHGNTSKTCDNYVDKSNYQLINMMLKLFSHILIFLLMLKKMLTTTNLLAT